MKKRKTILPDDPLRAASRLSQLPSLADDPPFLKAAWQEYVDAERRDKERASGKANRSASHETNQAFWRYCDAVKAAHDLGHAPLAQLDPHSGRPVCTKAEDW